MECRSRSVIESVDANEHQHKEPELRRLEEDKTHALTSDQEDKNEQAELTPPDDHSIKCCVLIQSWIRGFICRRNYQILKYQHAHALVSLLLPIYTTTDIKASYGQEHPVFGQDDTQKGELSEEPSSVIRGQEYQEHGAQKEYGSSMTYQDGTHVRSQSPEEILTMLTGLAESGSMQDFKSCLDLATSYGVIDEASEVEAQLIQRKENVQNWLEQVVHGWETTKSNIEVAIEDAKRLEMFLITTVAEAVMAAREKEIHKNLEASILKASRRNYTYWMRKAKTLGLEDCIKVFSKSFQRKIKLVRTSLRREAKLGAKEKYFVLFKNAISLGLQFDVNMALQIVLKRVLQVFKRAILLECTSRADDDSKEQDWKRIEMEGAEIGLDSRTLAELRQTLGAESGFESVQRIWTNAFKTNYSGGPFILCDGQCSSFEVVTSVIDDAESQLSGNSHQFSVPSGISLSMVSGSAATPESKGAWSVPRNWQQINRLQQDWQEHTFNLRSLGNNSNYLQQGEYSRKEYDSVLSKMSSEKIRETPTNPSVPKNLRESADLGHRQGGCWNSDRESGEAEEGCVELSETEEELRGVGQPHPSEMLERQKVISKKSILTREVLEKNSGCAKADLSWVMKLDLTDQHLKALGTGHIFRWCPRLRFLTVDMNKLTTLRGAFQGGEDRLEQVSVKDNLLQDMIGLECLGKISALHLDGNLLSQLGFPFSSAISANENGKKEGNVHINAKAKSYCSQPQRLFGFPVVEYYWPRLKVLTVSRNRLTKILQIGNLCPNLEVLDVGSNQIFSLGGTEDNSLAGLRNLRVLDVGQNRLQGRSLWKGLENCPELASLVASRNKLRELPTHFGSALLREIWLNGNAIKRLSCRAWLPSLQRLYLQDNMIDSLESLWGCPALEVLDLSFNSISDLSQLRHLSCFPCLRSLQLNDNPVSEQEDHTTCVLQAVPWLAELDNEAVAKASREKAVTKIFKRIMDVVGLEFLKDKLSKGEVLLRGFANASGSHRSAINRIEDSDSNTCQFVPQQEVNNVLTGDADECFLWDILLEAKSLASSNSIIKNLLTVNADMVKFEGLRNFSESELEARSNMIAYQQMTFGLKGKLHAATKETCIARTLKEGNQSVPCDSHRDRLDENSCPFVPFVNMSSESRLSSNKVGESNLEWCLEEHVAFDSSRGREVFIENKEYQLQAQTQTRRVVKLQALVRGHLTRIRTRLLKEQKTSMRQENTCACKIQAFWRGWKVRRTYHLNLLKGKRFSAAVSIQAHWRGFCVRQRLRQALEMAKYMDDDDFAYEPIDESEFLSGEVSLSALYQPNECVLTALTKSFVSASKTMTENNHTFAVNNAEGTASRKTDDCHKTDQLPCPLEYHRMDADDTAPLAMVDEIDASHGVEVSQGIVLDDTVTPEETECLVSPEHKICATQVVLQDKSTGLENLEKPEKKAANGEAENDITDLLERIGLKANLNTYPVLQGSDCSEEVYRIVNAHLEGGSSSSTDPKDHIVTVGSVIPEAGVKKTAAVDELTRDWGFKDENTAKALLKARKRRQQRAKDAAHENELRDPVQRLKRFKEKIQGQAPASGAQTRQFEKRASLCCSSLSLQMPVDEQESHTLLGPDILPKSETNLRKIDGCPSPRPIPRLPHQQRKRSHCTESEENKMDMRKHPTKNGRDGTAMHLPTVLLNTALQVASFHNL